MENKRYQKENQIVDPIGIDLGLTILGTAVTVMAFLHQFYTSNGRKKNTHLTYKLTMIKRELLRLQGSLDNLILILERAGHADKSIDFSKKSLSISDTMFDLKEEDYYRWLDVQDALKQIDRKIYEIISEIRALDLLESEYHITRVLNEELINKFDQLVLSIGQISFARLISELRSLLKDLTNAIMNYT